MPIGNVHAFSPVVDGGLQDLRQFRDQLHAVGSSRGPAAVDSRTLRGNQHFGGFPDRTDVTAWRRGHGEFRDTKVLMGIRILLQSCIADDGNRSHGRSHHDLVSPHGVGRKRLERSWIVVPFCKVTNHGAHVLRAVVPVDAAGTHCRVHVVSDDQEDRHAIRVGIVDRHRSMLQADGAVEQCHHRLAFDLGVSVGHCNRRFLVATGEQFGLGIVSVVDDGLVQAFKTGSGIGGDVFQVQRLEHVHHKVGAGIFDNPRVHGGGGRSDLGRQLCIAGHERRRTRCSPLLCDRSRCFRHQRRCACSRAL